MGEKHRDSGAIPTGDEDLSRFKSNFFGELREILEGQDRIRIEGDRFLL